MIIVHHLNNSRSQRILWLLEELGLEYRIERYERDPKTMLAPDALKRIHPLGKSPIVVDEGRTLTESGAIVDYLATKYDVDRRLLPAPDTDDYLACQRWLHYAEGSAMPPLLLKLVFDTIKSAPMPFFVKPIAGKIVSKAMDAFIGPQLKLHSAHWEASVTDTGWFVGDGLSVADVMMSFPVEAARSRDVVNPNDHPHLVAWLERVHTLVAYTTALEKGGEYDYA